MTLQIYIKVNICFLPYDISFHISAMVNIILFLCILHFLLHFLSNSASTQWKLFTVSGCFISKPPKSTFTVRAVTDIHSVCDVIIEEDRISLTAAGGGFRRRGFNFYSQHCVYLSDIWEHINQNALNVLFVIVCLKHLSGYLVKVKMSKSASDALLPGNTDRSLKTKTYRARPDDSSW